MSADKEFKEPAPRQRVVKYEDFTKAALARMLAEADAGARFSSMPIHKRRLAVEDEDDDEDDEMTKAADQDREERAELADKTRPGNAPETTPEDMPAAVSKRYGGKKKKPEGKA